jgi:hypothetical protein
MIARSLRPGPCLVAVLFFGLFLALGIGGFDDYGLSWDDAGQRHFGQITWAYVLHGDQTLLTDVNRYHGPAFELLLTILEQALGLDDSRAVYLMRHLVTFLLFYASAVVFYVLCARGFSNSWAGLLGSLLLVLHPRILAHSFYNSKDLPFLSVFIISVYTMTRYLEKKNMLSVLAHAAACGILVDIRILGIVVPALTVTFILIDLASSRSTGISRARLLASLSGYGVGCAVFTVALWPVLWRHPASQLLQALREMSHYSWYGGGWYMGDYVRADSVPWHYIPVWLSITTPILYSAAFLIGLFATVKAFLQRGVGAILDGRTRFALIALLWFFVPLATAIALRSVLYDSWRHMFFIYPGFVILAVSGLLWLVQLVRRCVSSRARVGLFVLMALIVAYGVGDTLRFIVKNHPHENVYFNRLAGKTMSEVKQRFELDYWGLSYRQALEYILTNDHADTIAVLVSNSPGRANAMILPSSQRDRLMYVSDESDATYFMSNYRTHPREYDYTDEFFFIKVGGARIMVVYTLKH